MMIFVRRLPKRIRFALVVVGLNMGIFTLFRIIFWMLFRPAAPDAHVSEFFRAFYLGFKFDLRLSLLICLPVLALSWIPFLNFVRSSLAKRIWLIYLVAMGVFLVLTYFVDLGHYDYLHDRLNASAIEHILPLAIALKMVWETYPVLLGILALFLFAIVYGWVLNRFAFRKLEQDGQTFWEMAESGYGYGSSDALRTRYPWEVITISPSLE